MHIAILGAHGKSGIQLISAAQEKGIEVTGVTRRNDPTSADHQIVKDVMDLTTQDLSGFDAVIDALGYHKPEDMHLHTDTLMHIVDILRDTQVRLFVVGGAGSLYTGKDHSVMMVDTPDFPKEHFPVARGMADALAKLVPHTDVDWVYVSPALEFIPDGPSTTRYVIGDDMVHLNADGHSTVSYTDFAHGMIDLLLEGGHSHKHLSIYAK